MQKRKLTCSLAKWALILAACAIPPVAHAQYSAPIDVGTFGGVRPSDGATAAANAINNLGIVTGDSLVPTGGFHAFIFTNGVPPLFDIGTLGQKSCHSESINDSGTVCGFIGNSLLADEGSILHAFVYAGVGMTDISALIPNSRKSWAKWVNNTGQVVGWYIDGATSHQRPFLYSGGVVTDLGFDGSAAGINDSGQIVGTQSGGQVVLISGGQRQVLTQLGNASVGRINNQGQIAGNRYVAANIVHAYVYSNGEVRDIGTLGGELSGMSCLNDAGQVVGDADTASGTRRPYLYENGAMVDLNTLIPSNTGWILTSAYGINNSGQIVGVGQFNGESRGFLLNPIRLNLTPFQNGSFELPGKSVLGSVAHLPPGDTSVTGWLVGGSGGRVALFNGTSGEWPSSNFAPVDGEAHLNFNGGGGSPGTWISQTFETKSGATYAVKFFVGRNGGGGGILSMTASAKSDTEVLLQQVEVFPPSQQGYGTVRTMRFTAASRQTTLEFKDTSTGGIDSQDIMLDNVSVSEEIPQNRVLSLDGQTGYISVPSAPDLQNPDEITIEARMYPKNDGHFIYKGDGQNISSSQSYGTGGPGPYGNLSFAVFLDGSTWGLLAMNAPTNQWTHFAGTFKSSIGLLQLFTNGVLAASTTHDVSGTIPLQGKKLRQTSLPLMFGNISPNASTWAWGYMDEVRIWTKARSAEEIASGVFCKLSGTEPALAGYWNFDDGTAKDQTTNHHDGTFHGSAIVTPMEVPGVTDCLSGSVPIILTQPQSQTLNAGDEAILTVTAVGSPTLLFQWVKDGTELSGQTNSTLILSDLTTDDTGNYKVIVSNSVGSATSQAATLTIRTFAPSISVQPVPSQIVPEGATVTISVQASAAPPPSYQWQSNGTNLLGETQSSLVLNDVTFGDAGNYKVIVSNPFGSETSQAAAIQVRPVLSLAQALGNTEVYWQTGGDAGWLAQTIVVHGGVAAAQSGHIQHGQKSTLETTVNGPGVLHFWWKSSTELGFDKVVFAINGQDQATLSGEKDWEQASFNLPAGVQNLHWEYVKDGSGSGGQDKAWITDVAYAPNAGVSQPSYLFAKRRLGYRLFQMTFTGQKGHQFEIEKSKDLRNWNNLTTIQNTVGTMTIVDPGAQTEAKEFYRAVQR
jgi:probable HAF family extracellular repeat protein